MTSMASMRSTRARLIALFVFGISANGAFGQANQGDALKACGRLIDHGLNQVEEKFGSAAYLDTVYYDFCSINSENRSDEKNSAFGIAIEGVPLNFSAGSKTTGQKRSEFCGTYKTSTMQMQQSYSYTSSLYAKALESWEKCLALAAAQVVIDPDIAQNRKSMTAFLAWRGLGAPGVKFQGVDIVGPISCTRNGGPVGANEDVLVTSEGMTISCIRAPIETTFAGVPARLYQDARVVFKTSASRIPIEFEPMVDDPARSQLQFLQTQLTNLDAKLRSANSRKLQFETTCLARHAPSCAGHGAGVAALPCPDGYTDTNMQERNWWSGGPCGQGSSCKVCYRFAD